MIKVGIIDRLRRCRACKTAYEPSAGTAYGNKLSQL